MFLAGLELHLLTWFVQVKWQRWQALWVILPLAWESPQVCFCHGCPGGNLCGTDPRNQRQYFSATMELNVLRSQVNRFIGCCGSG
jgi:hypothetical protein